VAEAQQWQEDFPCIQELRVLANLGHCPHDEAPEQVNPILIEWLQKA
jgi:pimeloyl-ACP methyl ester carboxylesterase